MLERIDELLLFLTAVTLYLVAIEAGFRLGIRSERRSPSGDVERRHISTIQNSLLGLLALLLGFSFAMASSRFETRKSLVQDEVNAIGTAYLRAELLPAPARRKAMDLLREYLTTRAEFSKAGADRTLMEAASADSSRVESKLWSLASTTESTAANSTTMGMFVQSLNDMINVKWKRRTGFDNHVPEPVIYLLLMVSSGALGFIAYGYGLVGKRLHVSTAMFALLIAMVLALVIDLDRPRGGLIRVNEESLLRLQAALDRDR